MVANINDGLRMILLSPHNWPELELELEINKPPHVDIARFASLTGPDVSCFPVVGERREEHYKYRVNTIIGQNKDQIALVFPHIGNEPFYCSIFAKLGDKKVDIINSGGWKERAIVVGLIFVITLSEHKT